LYLADPDGNGIEIYADRPRERWQYRSEQLLMATEALDVPSLLAELPPTAHDPEGNTIDPATRIGHVHLRVADLTTAEAFYRGALGFEVTVRGYPGALFVAADGYHHHIGLNVWAGIGAPPPPPNAVGLRYFTITIRTKADLQRLVERIQAAGIAVSSDADGWFLKDPASNGIRIIPDH
jgi:catechol 2,3-dioxygenase